MKHIQGKSTDQVMLTSMEEQFLSWDLVARFHLTISPDFFLSCGLWGCYFLDLKRNLVHVDTSLGHALNPEQEKKRPIVCSWLLTPNIQRISFGSGLRPNNIITDSSPPTRYMVIYTWSRSSVWISCIIENINLTAILSDNILCVKPICLAWCWDLL